MQDKFDVIVIGSGPGGEGAAMKAAKSGKQVAVVDEFQEVGGNCTHRGTIPSKTLRQAVQQLEDTGNYHNASFQSLLKDAESVIAKQVDLRTAFYERNLVDILIGRAVFVDAHTVEVTTATGAKRQYTADAFVIATGARPYHPADVDFSHPRILDSDSVLNLETNPRSLTIYGAGVVGCEYASIFRGLRIKVNLVNMRHSDVFHRHVPEHPD